MSTNRIEDKHTIIKISVDYNEFKPETYSGVLIKFIPSELSEMHIDVIVEYMQNNDTSIRVCTGDVIEDFKKAISIIEEMNVDQENIQYSSKLFDYLDEANIEPEKLGIKFDSDDEE